MDIERSIRLIPAHAANCGATRKAGDIQYLIYHYTGNKGDTAVNNGRYYSQKINPPASAHYFVDDNEVIQSVDDLTVAWAVGGKKWSDCAQTGGGKFYGIAKNANSISIEMCGTKSKSSYEASEATLENAVALGRLLMKRYNIPFENVIRHFDVTGKYCPAYFMDGDKWSAFKSRLSDSEQTCKEDGSMERRYQTFYEIQKAAPWAADTVRKLMERGALNGTGTGLDLSPDMIRLLVVNDRMGLYK